LPLVNTQSAVGVSLVWSGLQAVIARTQKVAAPRARSE